MTVDRQAKLTEGDWSFELRAEGGPAIGGIFTEERLIATVWLSGGETEEQARANGLVLAASKDLLEALQAYLANDGDDFPGDELSVKAKAAIAKAGQ